MNILESLENLNVSEECFNDIISIVEEYIHEVSVSTWKKAAISSLPKRAYKAGYAASKRDSILEPGEDENKYLEASDKALGHEMRMEHAAEVAKLPDSKMNANKVYQAARKSRDSRIQKKREADRQERAKGNRFYFLDKDYDESPAVKRRNHVNALFHTNKWTNYLLQ